MKRAARYALLAVPIVCIIVVPVFITGTTPRFFGMPPALWWTVLWMLLTPPCMFCAERWRSAA